MKIIHHHIKLIEDIMGKQKYSNNEDFRLLKYVKAISLNEGMLLYNVLTRCLILLDLNESKDILKISELKDFWFVVPQSFDDKKFCSQLKDLCRLFDKRGNSINSYTIFTTTDCNARCFYCYEKGIKHINMTNEVALDVANYIIRHHGSQKVYLSWFGGEPLYNLEAIDIICNKLKDAGVVIESDVTSNGYLFSENVIYRGKHIWNLVRTQITLDGTQKIYNKTKAYKYKSVNPFEIVLNNIEKLLEIGIQVVIRLNVSSKNQLDLEELVDLLHTKFGFNKNLCIYTHALFENTDCARDKSIEYKNENFESRQKINKKIDDYGYSVNNKEISSNLTLNRCMADSEHAISILPSGKLGKCYLYGDSEFCGSIYDGSLDSNMLAKFKEKVQDIPECDDCCYYPDCINLKMCGESKTCNEHWRFERKGKLDMQMLNTYNSYLKKQQINEEENDEIEIQC